MANCVIRALALTTILFASASPAHGATPSARAWEAVSVEASQLEPLLGTALHDLSALRCDPNGCLPIPFQVDERAPDGSWVLDGDPPDDSPGRLDPNDVVVFLARDAGPSSAATRPSGALHAVALDLLDPLGWSGQTVYLASYPSDPPRAPSAYVVAHPDEDRISSRTVALGFADGVPNYLALQPDGPNLLDRLKIRATVTLLWGLISVRRDESDLIPGPIAWHVGPIRVVRRQLYAIRVGFGIRSPAFAAYTLFYPDFARLPIQVKLRVPPRFFFTDIAIRAGLDLRRGTVSEAGVPSEPFAPVECGGPQNPPPWSESAGEWVAFRTGGRTLAVNFARGPSLSSVRSKVWYRTQSSGDPPEAEPGLCPGIGFELDGWDGVEGGVHDLEAVSYAVPEGVDLPVFLATVANPLEPRARLLW